MQANRQLLRSGEQASRAGEDAGADRRAGAEAGAALREDGAVCGKGRWPEIRLSQFARFQEDSP